MTNDRVPEKTPVEPGERVGNLSGGESRYGETP